MVGTPGGRGGLSEEKDIPQRIKSWIGGFVRNICFPRDSFIRESQGTSSVGLPIKLNSSGKLDSSFFDVIEVNDANFTLVDNSDTTKKVKFQLSGISAGTTRTWTFPDGANKTFVSLDNTQTLVNKTLTTPTIASFANANHDHSNSAGGGSTISPSLVNCSGKVVAATGIRSVSQSLTDDTVLDITFASMGFMYVTQVSGSGSGTRYLFCVYRATTSPIVTAIDIGADVTTGTTALTGTTGTDGKLNVACTSTGHIYVENRLGGTFTITVTFIG